EPDRMEPDAGGDVEDLLDASCSELVDEEAAFALVAPLPVNEFVPLLHEAADVLLGVVVGVANLERIVPEFLALNRSASCETSSGDRLRLRRDAPWSPPAG